VKEALKVLTPHLKVKEERKGKVVLGTIEGYLHDIGKNIVKTLLSSAVFVVYDLGIDAPSKAFVEKVKETGAGIIGISSRMEEGENFAWSANAYPCMKSRVSLCLSMPQALCMLRKLVGE